METVTFPILIALNCSTKVSSAVNQLVCLIPVGGNPSHVSFVNVHLFQRFCTLICDIMLVEYSDSQTTMDNLDDGICVSVIVDGAVVF